MVISNNNSRYNKVMMEDNKWTEVVSKKKQHDPFAGMKSSVDYELEIERLKQLVPKVHNSTIIDNHHKKKYMEKKLSHFHHHSIQSHSNHHYNNHTTTHLTPHTMTTHEFNNSLSRSTSPDTIHSTDSDNSSLAEIVTEEEKLRFLAFVRSWTGDWRKGQPLMNQWAADQSPWYTGPRRVSKLEEFPTHDLYWQTSNVQTNTYSVQPIGFGRKYNPIL
ncbi:uncharacterized protein B0P05DRAFT_585825 [Gilbertella persicaria]|uniref:uncharacterized protein n=1 Tax=Gilbertella persicaria TaxID=101096 RepID=UPI00221EC769|nr:uncharacterized protein B0P05DRAFT_585825 [Gilbertella persicaria]KAI8084059.1 hypothetical protein B0P05DRAFT_585825 [Gilbertella persicaria]